MERLEVIDYDDEGMKIGDVIIEYDTYKQILELFETPDNGICIQIDIEESYKMNVEIEKECPNCQEARDVYSILSNDSGQTLFLCETCYNRLKDYMEYTMEEDPSNVMAHLI